MDIYAITNQKGGVGKTTTTINLAAAMAEHGERVLVIDYDPQGHMTEALKMPEALDEATLKRAMCGEYTGDPHAFVGQFSERMSLIPTNIDMFLLKSKLYQRRDRERQLEYILESFADEYDVCVIDCPPSLGVITDNALYAARRRPGSGGGVIIPVQAEDSSIRALRLLLMQIDTLCSAMRIDLDLLGLLPNLYDARRGVIATSVLQAFRDLGRPPVLGVIGDRADVRKAWRAGQTVLEFAPDSESANWFRELAKSVRG